MQINTPTAADIETTKRIYDAINRNDIDAMANEFDPEILRIEWEGFPTAGTYRGIDAVKAHVRHGRGTWAEGTCMITEHAVVGEYLVLRIKVHVRLKDKTDWIDGEVGDVWSFRNGKAISFRSIYSFDDALAWARVS